MKRFGFITGLLVLSGFVAATPARAELLRITPTGVASNTYVGPTDPVPIGSDGFRLTYHGGGQDHLIDPVLLILGIPTPGAAPALTVSDDAGFDEVTVELGGSNVFNGSWNVGTGYAGTFNSASVGSVYDLVGLQPQGSPSQNYSNWNGQTGLTSWDIYVYKLTFDEDLSPNDPDWVEFSSSLAAGTYVIGYGHDYGTQKNPGETESTPFTFAGLVGTTRVPEPATLSLLLPALGLFAVRRRKSTSA